MPTAQERFEELNAKRSSVLKRARDCAELTIPALMPPDGHTASSELPTPHQGFGASGVNNLASKLLLALLPPNQACFKFELDPQVKRELAAEDESAVVKVNKELSNIEQDVQNAIEGSSDRIAGYEALRHLIVVGDVLLYMPNKGGMKLYRLDQYVIRRDKMGTFLEGVVKETVAKSTLSDKVRAACGTDMVEGDRKDDENVDVFTWIRRSGKQQVVHQEINGKQVPGSKGHYPEAKPAFIPLRWTAVANENYGRSLVYEYIGDLRSLEGLSQAVNEFAGNAAKIIWLTNPNGQTDPDELNAAESGEFVPGVEDDISCLSLEKFADFRIVETQINRLEKRLERAFLLTQSVQRDAERVTAKEIQLLARELEDALGGVYSVLSQEFQLPYIKRKVVQLQRAKAIPDFPEGTVDPKVTTGLEALGRGHDLAKLGAFLDDLSRLPEALAQRLVQQMDEKDLATRLATAHGLNTTSMFRDPKVVAAEQEADMRNQMITDAAPGVAQEAVRQAGSAMQPQ